MPKLASLLASFAFAALATQAIAQQPPAPTVRIRGTIEAVDGPMLSIKSREGTDMKVKMTDNVVVFAVVKTELSEIKPNSYIGVTAMPEPDGTQRAIAVHIFPETQRGAAEGFRPWDARPNSTVTNATVAAFNLFDEAWVLAGASLDTRPMLVQIYLETFQNLHFSYGMALSLVVTVVSLLVSLVYVIRIHHDTRFD